MSDRAGSVAVLANPTAGRGRYRGLLPEVVQLLGACGRPVTLLEAQTADEAEDACRRAVAEGAAALVAVGGDGTVHRALQAVAGTDVAFGVVPAGTGNDFAAELGLPAEALAAAEALAGALAGGRTRRVDLAELTGPAGERRWYGAVLAAGFDALVNERANRMRWPRGERRYDIAILAELIRLRPRAYRITVDGTVHEVEALMVAVGNGASYGGGMRITPTADLTDGLLDIVVVGRISRLTFMRIKPRVYAGTHIEHPAATVHRASTVEVAAEGITAYADGERVCPLPVTVRCVPGALTVLGDAGQV